MNKYVADVNTFMVMPLRDLEYNSKIYTKEGIIKSAKPPLEIIKDSCVKYFSNYEGRRKSAIDHANFHYKVPIIVSKIFNIYAFPTNSPNLFHTTWIFANNLVQFKKINKGKSEILFTDGTTAIVNVSSHVLNTQLNRVYALMHRVQMLKDDAKR